MQEIIAKTASFVRERLHGAEAGHDWWHILRVWNTTRLILKYEKADGLVCELAALLHDIADSKFHGGDEQLGPSIADDFLRSIHVDAQTVAHIKNIILNMSYTASLGQPTFRSKEMDIVQDADRLDAIGAIGIARAFHYGGFKNREIYNPDIPAEEDITKENYKNTTAPTINHFYEKLLLLKDKMNTPTARRIASERHHFMELYLQHFYDEWNGSK